jgi:hypothetical protein
MFRIAALVAAMLFPISALATPISVHNTGVNSSDVLVAPGAQTAFWTLLTEPVGASETIGSNPFRYFNGAYAADSATSAWVSPTSSGNAGVGGNYVYQLLIDLSGLDPTTAVITGRFGTDNDGFIDVNGGPAAASQGFAGFGVLTNFTLNSGFHAGINSIQISVDNGGDPTAFRAEFLRADANPVGGSTTVPEPTSMLLLGSGVVAAAARRRRQRSRPQ